MGRPHILLITTDQHRAGFTLGDGFLLDTMPAVDALGAAGRRLRQAYTTAPACVPARTSLLTGRWPKAHRVRQNSAENAVVRGDDLLDVLRGQGYAVHFAGKPHMYRGPDDFDSYAGSYWHDHGPAGDAEDDGFARWLAELDHGVSPVATPYPLRSQFPHRIVSAAVETVRAIDRPSFLWASFPEPHNPYQVPEPYFSMFPEESIPAPLTGRVDALAKGGAYAWLADLQESKRPGLDKQWRRYRANYCGMLRLIDDQIARLIASYRERGILDDTVVIVTSDHGDYTGEYGLQRKGAGTPEVLMRVPFVISGAGIAVYDDGATIFSLADLMPTLAELAGAKIPLGVQGRSLAPVLGSHEPGGPGFESVYAERGVGGLPYPADARPPLHFGYDGPSFDELNTVTQSGDTKMLRRGRWKLLYDAQGAGELYDLYADPMELTNLFADPGCSAIHAAMVEELLRWSIRLDDELPDAAYTTLRAPHNWR